MADNEVLDIWLNHNLLIVWKPEYDLKIPIIDEHHRGIVSTINAFYFGMQHNHGKELLKPISTMIYEYTRIHFQVEEDFQKKFGYPGIKQHHELHNVLTQELLSVSKKSIWDQDPTKFLEFLKDWWINHICNEDRQFADYFHKKTPGKR